IFELPELKLLVDAIQSTKFITKEKSRELISKLEIFAGRHLSGDLSRQVYVEGRVKTMNGAVLETVDGIHNAIREKKQISFLYFTYTPRKTREYRNGGHPYVCSPLALLWNDENYYLVAFDEAAGVIKHFRVDKMEKLTVTKNTVPDREELRRFDPAVYSEKAFGMYNGKEELVVLECAPRLAPVILDRFGSEPTFIMRGDRFRVALKVMVSPNFFSWVMTFGADMEIVSPESVRAEMKEKIGALSALYGNGNTIPGEK
ncbi:MAG: WYL domain-containing protein, partial [Clostridia bacterium]|nr:WYL domain-containing protein [Clostridia bacterium]